MKCPFCTYEDSRVLNSRSVEEGSAVRRRRECLKCGRRFTTYERIDEYPLIVVKKDDRREVFDRHKLLQGMMYACRKRPVSMDRLEAIVGEVERELRSSMKTEIPSSRIGEMVVERLRQIDEVAYVRFASVYRNFRDVRGFVQEVEKLSGASDSG